MFQKSLQISLCISLFFTSSLKQINSPVMAQSTYSYLNSYQDKVTLAKNTPILITIPDTISIDIKDEETIPAAAILSEPLFDRYGRQLAPQGATVTITLKPSSKKAGKVFADSIMAGRITIPIKASSEEIASRKIKLEKDSHTTVESSQIGQGFGSLLGTALAPSGTHSSNALDSEQRRLESVNNQQKRLETQQEYNAIGGLVGGLIGLASGGKTIRLVELKAGHTLALKLEEDAIVNLPPNYLPQSNPNLANQNYQPQKDRVNRGNNNNTYNSNPNAYSNQSQRQFTNNPSNSNTGNQVANLSHSGAANGSIHRMNGQPISPSTLARLRSLLAGKNLVESSCGTTPQQVTIRVNNEFILCGYPNSKYSPGNYSINLNGLY